MPAVPAAVAPAAPVAAPAAPPAAIAAPAELTLVACVQEARRHSYLLQQARRQVRIADWQVQEAWAPSLPQLSAGGRWTTRNNDSAADMLGSQVITADRATTTGSLTASITLLDFGRSGYWRDALRLLSTATGLEAERTGQDLDFAVHRAYLAVLGARRLREVAAESVHLLDRYLVVANDLHAQGLVAANDLTGAEVQKRQREDELLRAVNAVANAEAALNQMLGRALDAPVSLADMLETPPWQGSYEAVLTLARRQRPDLESLRQRIRAGAAAVKSAKAALAPRIYAFGDWTYADDSHIVNHQWWDGGVGLSLSLYDGGATIAMAGRAFDELAQIEDAARDREERVALDVRQAWLGLNSAGERIPVAQAAAKLAEDNQRAVEERYQQGLISGTDVLAEEQRLVQARADLCRAFYDRHEAYARLVNAVGGDPTKPLLEGKP
jgi:outer membrane protein TolC